MVESTAGPSKKGNLKIYRGSESLFDHFSRLGTSQSASARVVSNETSVQTIRHQLVAYRDEIDAGISHSKRRWVQKMSHFGHTIGLLINTNNSKTGRPTQLFTSAHEKS